MAGRRKQATTSRSGKTTAYVLSSEKAAEIGVGLHEAVTFAGAIPGTFMPGEPTVIEAMEDEEVDRIIAERELPLEKTTAKAVEYPEGTPPAIRHSSADLPSSRVGHPSGREVSRSPVAGLSREEYEARVAEERDAGAMSPVVAAAVRADEGEDADVPEPPAIEPTLEETPATEGEGS